MAEPNEIETTADGVVCATGAFVRTFWEWTDARPDAVTVRARIAGVNHAGTLPLSTLTGWVWAATDGTARVAVAGHEVNIPAHYLGLMLDQIIWFADGQVGPVPRGQVQGGT